MNMTALCDVIQYCWLSLHTWLLSFHSRTKNRMLHFKKERQSHRTILLKKDKLISTLINSNQVKKPILLKIINHECINLIYRFKRVWISTGNRWWPGTTKTNVSLSIRWRTSYLQYRKHARPSQLAFALRFLPLELEHDENTSMLMCVYFFLFLK